MPRSENDSTISIQLDRGAHGPPVLPFLFVVLQADRPLGRSARYPLAGVESVALGREAMHPASAQEGVVTLGFPDRSVSSAHAVLRRHRHEWRIEDRGSKNGTKLNGVRVQDARLADGDWIEIGNTFLRFRSGLAVGVGAARQDSAALQLPALGLATLLPSLAEEFARLALVAAADLPVLLAGESGVGKEVAAAALHQLSRRPGAFQAVNCGGLSKNLVESELFGYRKGAFSGADEDRPGLIRASDGGTLFLDEIGDLPLAAQASLLRVLQEAEVTPVGGTKPVKVDLRLVAATHRDLDALVSSGGFRADLLARLAGFILPLPALRDRREDLGLLIAALLGRHFPAQAGIAFTSEAARALLTHGWPLNVRELEKCLTAAVVLADGGTVELSHLPAAVRDPGAHKPPSGPALAAVALSAEDEALRVKLVGLFDEHRGNITAVAEAMGKARFQVQRWVKRLGIEVEGFKR